MLGNIQFVRHKNTDSLFITEMLERLNKIWRMQEAYTDYPKAASENAKAALRWAEKNGWKGCGTAVGKARANQLANREPISLEYGTKGTPIESWAKVADV